MMIEKHLAHMAGAGRARRGHDGRYLLT
jgi:hypothetical protein